MARQTNNRRPKFRIAIVGEGITEWFYFTNMRQCENFNFKVEPELPKHSDYKTIIRKARSIRDDGYDLVYCVLDLDKIITNDTERKGYHAEKTKKRANNRIRFIETMPCIELWFLLHFLEKHSSRVYLNYKQVSKNLKHFFPEYEKTTKFLRSVRLYDYLIRNGKAARANELALKLEQEKQQSDNPYFNFTQINHLIRQLKD